MAARFFYDPYEYDPYGYYTAAPYGYNPCYRRQPAATRRSTRGIFAGAEPAAAKPAAPRGRKTRETKTSFSIPVHDSKPVAPAMSAEEAVVRMQATARGFLARKAVRAVRQVQREAEQIAMSSEVEVLVADPRARVAVGEALMRMLLRLDAVRGAREYRRSVAKWVLAMQDAVDALAPATAPVSSGGEEAADADAPEATTDVETEEESVAAQELRPDAAERDDEDNEMESIKTLVDTPTQVVEVDEAVAAAASEPEAEQGEEEKKDANVDVDEQVEEKKDANVDVHEPEDSDAEVEWEMVTEEESEHIVPVAAIAAMSDDQEPSCKEPTYPLQTMTTTASTGADSDGVDVRKLMEMVVALRQQSAQQCAVIGALAERVDALELTVRQMEDAESHRQQAKMLSAEHKEHMNQ